MFDLACRSALIWLLIAIVAVVNGVLREQVLAPAIGPALSLPASGLILALLVLLVTFLSFGFLGIQKLRSALLTAGIWVLMTLAFEFLFGHYVAGKSWQEIVQVFDITSGNLFILVLATTAAAPVLTLRLRKKP